MPTLLTVVILCPLNIQLGDLINLKTTLHNHTIHLPKDLALLIHRDLIIIKIILITIIKGMKGAIERKYKQKNRQHQEIKMDSVMIISNN